MKQDTVLVWKTVDCFRFLQSEIVPFNEQFPLPQSFWLSRAEIEHDPAWQQPIPYVVLHRSSRVWAYRRKGGDDRLDGRFSIGVGGHVDPQDKRPNALDTLLAAALRELREELAFAPPLNLVPVAWIHEHESEIGCVHLGLVFAAHWTAGPDPQVRKGEKLESVGFLKKTEIPAGTEKWSHLALEALNP